MPNPSPSRFTIGTYGESIIAEIVERSDSTGADEVVDISAATLIKMLFRTPDYQPILKTAVLVNSGTDGLMEYVVESGFFDKNNRRLLGTWKYRPSFTLGTFVADPDFGSSHEWGHFILSE